MRRCHYCPSTELRSVHFHPIDFVLILLLIRRRRCEFCGQRQWTWYLPRPLRWVLGVVLLVAVYLASAGPVTWLHEHYRMSDNSYERMKRWVYAPIIKVLQSDEIGTISSVEWYEAYCGLTQDPSAVESEENSAHHSVPNPFYQERKY